MAMAENVPEGSGFFYPQDAAISELSITTSKGQKYDVKYLMADMAIFEDLYSFVMTGYMLLKDGIGLIESWNLSGNEIVTVTFGKTKNNTTNPMIFRLYSIPRRDPAGNLTTEYIKLYFCSEELILSEQTKMTKSYKGMQISEMIDDIMKTGLGIPLEKRNNIYPTMGVYNIILPTIKPLEAISWLSNYARPRASNGNTKLADMLFFQTQNGFYFKSLSSMYEDNVYRTYKYQIQNITADDEPPAEDVISILDYQFIKTFDTLKETRSGTFANRLISLDPLTRKVSSTVFDYQTDIKTTLNPISPLVPEPNRLGVTENKSYNGCLKMGVSNAGQQLKSYIPQGSVSPDIFLEAFVPNRTAQLALSNYTVVKIRIPGDPFVTVGKLVNFNLPSLSNANGTKELDKLYSGKYLVTAVRHIIQSPTTYQTVLELAKESTPQG
jgi:hypothetical protein